MNKKPINLVAMILLIIGGLNWGLIGAFKFDLVDTLLGSIPILRDIVYILVGIAAIYMIVEMAMKKK
ncbi:MAG: DUF378 domain-containing protein [Nanoarchaeota archaeon]|nr:DUF378 domain-containing protein [Nanoarchaeota archaeon]